MSLDDEFLGHESAAPAQIQDTTSPAVLTPVVLSTVWRPPASYSSFTADGAFNLFEGGLQFRYQSLMLANESQYK